MILDKDYFLDRNGIVTDDPQKKFKLFGRKGQMVPDSIASKVGIGGQVRPVANKAETPSPELKIEASAVDAIAPAPKPKKKAKAKRKED
jgi:hypothetical protein